MGKGGLGKEGEVESRGEGDGESEVEEKREKISKARGDSYEP